MTKANTLNVNSIKSVGTQSKKHGVQNFADYQGATTHYRFDQMLDQTIYIVNLERMSSENFGSGFKVFYKDLPNTRDTYDCCVFGAYPVQQLESLYTLSHDAATISYESPVKTTIRAAGKSYRFE